MSQLVYLGFNGNVILINGNLFIFQLNKKRAHAYRDLSLKE